MSGLTILNQKAYCFKQFVERQFVERIAVARRTRQAGHADDLSDESSAPPPAFFGGSVKPALNGRAVLNHCSDP